MAKHTDHLSTAERAPQSLIRRLRFLMERAAVTGTPVAFMRLAGELSESEHDACVWFHALHERYQRALDVRGVKSQAFEPAPRAEPPDPFSELGERRSRPDRIAVAEFKSAELAAIGAGRSAYCEFCKIVIDEHAPKWEQKRSVALVAHALARHRQLGSRQRRGRR